MALLGFQRLSQHTLVKTVLKFVALVILFTWSVLLCLHYGQLGIMPLDQSIMFDGGWRILSGQIPFKDFTTPNGFVVMLLQAMAFKFWGVTWWAYVFHAALFNGFFTVLSFAFLKRLGLPFAWCWITAMLTAIVFYPPFGVAYMEQHAFFFTLLFLYLTLWACQTQQQNSRRYLSLLLPVVFALAWFSKQIPSVFALPVAVGMLVWFGRTYWREILQFMSFGSLLCGLLLLAIFVGFHMHWDLFMYYYFHIVAGLGATRAKWILQYPSVLFRWDLAVVYVTQGIIIVAAAMTLLQNGWKRFSQCVFVGIGLLSFLLLVSAILATWTMPHLIPAEIGHYHRPQLLEALWRLTLSSLVVSLLAYTSWRGYQRYIWAGLPHYSIGYFLISQALLVICFGFSTLACNQAVNGIPFCFMAFALAIWPWLQSWTMPVLPFYTYWSRRLLLSMMLLISLWDAWHFNASVNDLRIVQDTPFRAVSSSEQHYLPTPLKGLTWGYSPRVSYTLKDLRAVYQYLKTQNAPFFLLGDSSFLYGITGQPSLHPALFFCGALATPPRSDRPAFAKYERQLIHNIRKTHAQNIVLEGPITQMGNSLADYKQVQALLKQHGCGQERFGAFTVLKLCGL